MEPRTSTPASSEASQNGALRQIPRAVGHPPRRGKDRYWLHLLLFLLTLGTTTWMGGMLVGRYPAHAELGQWWFVPEGLRFAGGLLTFLTVHEFGHYFAARYHRIRTSLPYYIPAPFAIGTLGAVIRIREPIPSTRKLFDVGAGGPLAGFVVALAVLVYALATLPPPEYLLQTSGHEALKEYIAQHGTFPDEMLSEPSENTMVFIIGQTPLYWLLTQFFPNVPPMYEMMHYPLLLAGWFGLFFTALNLLPVGQLDGGHVLYALVGRRWHRRLARGFTSLLLASASIGFFTSTYPLAVYVRELLGPLAWFALAGVLYFFLIRIFDGDHWQTSLALLAVVAVTALAMTVLPGLEQFGYFPWFIWCLLVVFLIKVEHPPVMRPEPLTPRRRALALLSILIFILCFSLTPIVIA